MLGGMDKPYTYFADLAAEANTPSDGILSRTLHQDDRLKIVLFGFATGQELSEHTASMPAIMHFIKGDATVLVGGDTFEVGAGAWFHMLPNTVHSVRTKTPLVMLLTLLK